MYLLYTYYMNSFVIKRALKTCTQTFLEVKNGGIYSKEQFSYIRKNRTMRVDVTNRANQQLFSVLELHNQKECCFQKKQEEEEGGVENALMNLVGSEGIQSRMKELWAFKVCMVLDPTPTSKDQVESTFCT